MTGSDAGLASCDGDRVGQRPRADAASRIRDVEHLAVHLGEKSVVFPTTQPAMRYLSATCTANRQQA